MNKIQENFIQIRIPVSKQLTEIKSIKRVESVLVFMALIIVFLLMKQK